jgi:hypothetical protein
MGLGNIMGALESMAGGSGNLEQAFSQVAANAGQGGLASALTHAFQSDQTPPFGQMVGSMFGNSNPDQKAGMLNQLAQSLGPQILASGALGSLGSLLGGGAPITPAQAAQVSPEEVQAAAEHAQKHNPSIVEEASNFYAQHPTLVQGLGAAALGMMMSHMTKK